MNVRALGVAISLVLTQACTTSGSHSRAEGSTPPPSTTPGADTGAGAGASPQAAPPSEQQAPPAPAESQGAQPSEQGAAQGEAAAPGGAQMSGPLFKGHSTDQVISGKIGEVSADSLSIESDQGDTKVLAIVPQTHITVGGESASYGDLQEGQPVHASFAEVNGTGIAVEINADAPTPGESPPRGNAPTPGESPPRGTSEPSAPPDASGGTMRGMRH